MLLRCQNIQPIKRYIFPTFNKVQIQKIRCWFYIRQYVLFFLWEVMETLVLAFFRRSILYHYQKSKKLNGGKERKDVLFLPLAPLNVGRKNKEYCFGDTFEKYVLLNDGVLTQYFQEAKHGD
eukprot:TRINITY_DN71951_c1_g1_i12.p2 TRINITY_DN71951_c1_g1~~TRINITY_DN71951_c1_g1_i12.p2  ORF type:complete len:122 (+),score=4.69 TRINITY_DN71951_c1_g1_i12:987-1352(+)